MTRQTSPLLFATLLPQTKLPATTAYRQWWRAISCVWDTFAHAIEPKYPGAFEQPINLCDCWNEHKLFEERLRIMPLAAKISRCHEHCCRFLGAANSLLADTYRIALDATASAKAGKAAQRIAQAEFKGDGIRKGRESVRFLSAITDQGPVQFGETASLLCERIYQIEDSCGATARLLLNVLRSEALTQGYDIISCYCPLSPFDKLEHLFIPALRLGFMSVNDAHSPVGEAYKVIRARRFTDTDLLKKARKRIAFNKKAASQMLESASRLLGEAKTLHDQLEFYYTAAMDFEQVNAVSDQTLAKFEALLQHTI